jgi:hypothetical protein
MAWMPCPRVRGITAPAFMPLASVPLAAMARSRAWIACPAGHLTWRKESEDAMEDMSFAFFWSGPIGLGVFLAGLGVLFWGISRYRGK